MKLADVPVVYHEIETNGIGYVNVMFDLSGVSAEELADVGILQSVLELLIQRTMNTVSYSMR